MEGVSSHFDHVTGRHVIEVYFKDAKQHPGFLKEQTATFASHAASILQRAIRYMVLAHNKLDGQDTRIGGVDHEDSTSGILSVLAHVCSSYFAPSYQERSMNCTLC